MKRPLLIAVLLAAVGLANAANPLENWYLTGTGAKSYQIGVDSAETISGQPARFIRYVEGDGSSFGMLGQTISAKSYQGKRVRFQAMIKTRDVTQWAGLLMSALRPDERHASAFYNSQDKPIAGTNDWQLRSVTLDIPGDAATLNIGVIDGGRGQVWIDQLSLEVVGQDVPVDFLPGRRPPSDTPSL
ncbi:transcriptional regulator [Duganella dendranthematis]|jgi:hypothetical protein|uniref:Transcriptional regulator n=1 Tax=Duganella dendranthematis TaxID=2728021 RepID=A0ABX6MAE1_9BURK|nr:transcriptional regulator [Duganella dendranthematis]QJD91283.1 transcriptional regulator [Duganella dendranthematis]